MSRMRRLAPCPRGHGALCRPYTLLGLPLLRPTRVTAGWNPNVDRCSAAKPINPHTGAGSRTARVRMCQAPDDGLRPGGLHPSTAGCAGSASAAVTQRAKAVMFRPSSCSEAARPDISSPISGVPRRPNTRLRDAGVSVSGFGKTGSTWEVRAAAQACGARIQ